MVDETNNDNTLTTNPPGKLESVIREPTLAERYERIAQAVVSSIAQHPGEPVERDDKAWKRIRDERLEINKILEVMGERALERGREGVLDFQRGLLLGPIQFGNRISAVSHYLVDDALRAYLRLFPDASDSLPHE